jgi:hypothetical protein
MASIVVAGDTSGTVTLAAPATAGTTTLTLPTANGTLVTTASGQTLTSPTISGVSTFAAGTAAAPAITTTGDTNTGIFFSAADTIDFAEGGVAVGQFDSSANFKFNSGYGSVATAYGCRAWVNFNGTGTVAIRGSGNVTSITDNGTGDYTVNFTTSMPDANYSAVANASDTPTLNRWATLYQGFILAGSVRLVVAGSNSTPADVTTVCVSVSR